MLKKARSATLRDKHEREAERNEGKAKAEEPKKEEKTKVEEKEDHKK